MADEVSTHSDSQASSASSFLGAHGAGATEAHNRTLSTIDTPISKTPRSAKTPKNSLSSSKFYEVDYIGNGSFQVSQLNLLGKRSLEPIKSEAAQLSARNLGHRSIDVFSREVMTTSNLITSLMRGEKVRSAKYKPSPQLFQPHFQRALAYERLHQIDKAIADYTICLRINDRSAVCYFNRSGLYKIKKNFSLALDDINKALEVEPGNIDYRVNRALLCRESGLYATAVKDTITTRAISKYPEMTKILESGGQINIDSEFLTVDQLAEDSIFYALSKECGTRSKAECEPIIDFLKTLKIFSSFGHKSDVLYNVANKVTLHSYLKGMHIFDEGDVGHCFYMILEGKIHDYSSEMNFFYFSSLKSIPSQVK